MNPTDMGHLIGYLEQVKVSLYLILTYNIIMALGFVLLLAICYIIFITVGSKNIQVAFN